RARPVRFRLPHRAPGEGVPRPDRTTRPSPSWQAPPIPPRARAGRARRRTTRLAPGADHRRPTELELATGRGPERARGQRQVREQLAAALGRAHLCGAAEVVPGARARRDHRVPTKDRRTMILYRLIQRTVRFAWPRIGTITVLGLDNIPSTGPFLLISNHQSVLDAILIQAYCPRLLHTMAKSTQFAAPVIGPLMTRLYSFPVRRYEIDPQAVRTVLRRLGE